MLKHTKNTNNNGIRFYKQIYHEYNVAPKLGKQNCFQNHIKNYKATKFLFQLAI